MNEFDYDCYLKKRIARGASKSRNNHGYATALTPKPYTNKEITKMHGPVYTVNYRKPMTYEELKTLPAEMQKKYLEHLMSRFDIRLGTLEYMLGKSPTVLSHRNRDLWKIELSVGGKPKMKAIEEFKAWVDVGGDPDPEPEVVEEPIEEEPIEEEPAKEEPHFPAPHTEEIRVFGKATRYALLKQFELMLALCDAGAELDYSITLRSVDR